mgnify:CR=1 FL=1
MHSWDATLNVFLCVKHLQADSPQGWVMLKLKPYLHFRTTYSLDQHFAAYSNAADISLDRAKPESILQTPDPRAAM